MAKRRKKGAQTKAPRSWKTRRFSVDDLPRMPDFVSLFGERHATPAQQSPNVEYYHWKYCSCPVEAAEVTLAEDDETLIGIIATVPKSVKIRGQLVRGAELSDAFTHPGYQGQGIYSTILKKCCQDTLSKGICFIYGTPNKQALPIEQRCGFEVVPCANVLNVVRPLNMQTVLQAIVKLRLLATVASPFLRLAYALLFRLDDKRWKKGLSITEVDSFPEDVERLWAETSQNYDVILVRDSDYLKWRYISNPNRYTILVARDAEGIVGYLVTRVQYRRNLRVGCIADFLVLHDDREVFKALLTEAFTRFLNCGVDLIYCWAIKHTAYHSVLRRTGFVGLRKIPVICYKNDLGSEILKGRYKWHFTVGDSDNV